MGYDPFRQSLAVMAIALGAVLTGCASTYHVDGQPVSQRRFAEEDDVPNVPKGVPPSCRVASVEQLFVEVECEYVGNPTEAEWETGISSEFHRAAEVAVVSGRAFIVRVTSEAEAHYLTSRNPVHCETRINSSKVAANVLRGFANGLGRGSVDINCHAVGADTSCTGSVTPPPPPVPLVHRRRDAITHPAV
jgi:hypothetical protein